ncbi:MAG: BatA domain-containing protein [Saprospiraceae bacterium]
MQAFLFQLILVDIFGATMQFLYPPFLWALTALSIPIVLHLFYFRRYKKIYFSSLRFLREVKEETSARNRLRNLLILLSRLLAFAFMILAFAQPYIPINETQKEGIRDISIFVDNSYSMQSFGQDLSLFDRSRQKAKEIIMGYGQEDHFQILGHELSPSQNLWISRDEALLRLEEMEFTPEVKPLSIVTGRQKQSFAREDGAPVAWIISDFQKSITDFTIVDSLYPLNLLPLKSVQEKNIAVDSAWFESPLQTLNQTAPLLFSIHNYTGEDADNVRVTVSLDGQERPEGSVDIAGGKIKIDTSNITVLSTGWHELAIRISDFPVTFDDTYFLTFYVEQNLKILSINDHASNEAVSAVFANQKNFILDESTINSLEFASLTTYDLIILNELPSFSSGLTSVLHKYVQDGGKVLFFPSAKGSLDSYNSLMTMMGAGKFQPFAQQERQVGKINTEAFVYHDVFSRTRSNMRLPKVSASFPIEGSGSRGQSLLSFRDGGDLITFYTPGKGAFCVVTAPLDQKINDLSLQPEVFVPLLYKMAIYSSDEQNLAYTIGKDQLISLDKSKINIDKDIQVTGPAQFIPGISALGSKILLDVQGQVKEAGFYKVILSDSLIASLAFNYDRRESDLTLTNVEELAKNKMLKVWSDDEKTDFTQLIEDTRQGKQMWKWCIILSLIFIGMEIALIRLWKNR